MRDSRTLQDYPVLIECKGYKNKLEKLNANGIVDNENKANINSYAVNGAIHYSKAVKTEYIQLPIKNNEPAYSFMELFIKAVEKLVIKDVVLYADKKIDATRQVAGNH